VTVRSEAKGKALLAAYPNASRDKLSYVIVDDIAKEGAFDDVSVKQIRFRKVSEMKQLAWSTKILYLLTEFILLGRQI
jgi:hypothetical protein